MGQRRGRSNNNHGLSSIRDSTIGSHGIGGNGLHGKEWRQELSGEIRRISKRVRKPHQPPTDVICYCLGEVERLVNNPTDDDDISLSCPEDSDCYSSPVSSSSSSSLSSFDDFNASDDDAEQLQKEFLEKFDRQQSRQQSNQKKKKKKQKIISKRIRKLHQSHADVIYYYLHEVEHLLNNPTDDDNISLSCPEDCDCYFSPYASYSSPFFPSSPVSSFLPLFDDFDVLDDDAEQLEEEFPENFDLRQQSNQKKKKNKKNKKNFISKRVRKLHQPHTDVIYYYLDEVERLLNNPTDDDD